MFSTLYLLSTNFKNAVQFLTSHIFCNQILHSDKYHKILVVDRPKICTTNPKWRTAAILKKRTNCYISTTTDFYEVLHADAYCPPNPKRCLKKIKFKKKSKMVDGHHVEKF